MGDVDQTTPTTYVPKGGRRRRNNEGEQANEAPTAEHEKPPQPTKKNGWGDDSKAGAADDAPPTMMMMKDESMGAEEGEGPGLIPSLEPEAAPKEEEVNIGFVVASAPVYRQSMPLLVELERQNARLPPVRDDTDLSLLTAVFTPAVEDEDVEWVPDHLFITLMSDIQAEADALLPPEEKDPGAKDLML